MVFGVINICDSFDMGVITFVQDKDYMHATMYSSFAGLCVLFAPLLTGAFYTTAEQYNTEESAKKKARIRANNDKLLDKYSINSLSGTQRKVAREYLSNPENTTPLTFGMLSDLTSTYNRKIIHEECLKNEEREMDKQRSIV